MIESLVAFYVAIVEPYLWPVIKLVIFFLVVMAVIWLVAFMRELDNVVLMARRTMAFTWKFSVGTVLFTWQVFYQTGKFIWFIISGIYTTVRDFFIPTKR